MSINSSSLQTLMHFNSRKMVPAGQIHEVPLYIFSPGHVEHLP